MFIINLCQNNRSFDIIKSLEYTSDSKYDNNNYSNHHDNNGYNLADNDSNGDEKCDWNNLQEVKLSKVN